MLKFGSSSVPSFCGQAIIDPSEEYANAGSTWGHTTTPLRVKVGASFRGLSWVPWMLIDQSSRQHCCSGSELKAIQRPLGETAGSRCQSSIILTGRTSVPFGVIEKMSVK